MLLLWIFLLVFLLAYGTIFFHYTHQERKSTIKTMIVLGSGGHTTEMFSLLNFFDIRKYAPRCYVIADSDTGGQGKAVQFESEVKSDTNTYCFRRIPRSRFVGQSWATTPISTLKSFLSCLYIVFAEDPDLILTNGPGTCVPVVFAGIIMKILGRRNHLVFSESFACVDHLSLSGKILYRLVDQFFVQWPKLCTTQKSYVHYGGRFPQTEVLNPQPNLHRKPNPKKLDQKGYVLVTVGSTKFDELIENIDTAAVGEWLSGEGYQGIVFQYGTGSYEPRHMAEWLSKQTPEVQTRFTVESFRLRPSLTSEIQRASVVVSHCGAGTVLEVLPAAKPLVVVPNPRLMNNHQRQLADQLDALGLVVAVSQLPTSEWGTHISQAFNYIPVLPPETDTVYQLVNQMCMEE